MFWVLQAGFKCLLNKALLKKTRNILAEFPVLPPTISTFACNIVVI